MHVEGLWTTRLTLHDASDERTPEDRRRGVGNEILQKHLGLHEWIGALPTGHKPQHLVGTGTLEDELTLLHARDISQDAPHLSVRIQARRIVLRQLGSINRDGIRASRTLNILLASVHAHINGVAAARALVSKSVVRLNDEALVKADCSYVAHITVRLVWIEWGILHDSRVGMGEVVARDCELRGCFSRKHNELDTSDFGIQWNLLDGIAKI